MIQNVDVSEGIGGGDVHVRAGVRSGAGVGSGSGAGAKTEAEARAWKSA